MTTRYEVRLAGRVVSTRDATSARQAASDYVRSLGCRADEIIAVAADAVAWRGAVYRAAPMSTATSSSSSNSFSGARLANGPRSAPS